MDILGICLSDIPKNRMHKASNGKIYANIVVADLKEPDRFGNDLTVFMQQPKDEREAGTAKEYIGKGKRYNFSEGKTTEDISSMPPVDPDDDLPF